MSCLLLTTTTFINLQVSTTKNNSDIALNNIAVMEQACNEGASGCAYPLGLFVMTY